MKSKTLIVSGVLVAAAVAAFAMLDPILSNRGWRAGDILTVLWSMTFPIALVGLWFGRKCLAVAIPAVLLFLMLAAILIPDAIPAHPQAQRNACINNLHQLQRAKLYWAKEFHKLPTDTPTENDIYATNGTNALLRTRLICPAGGVYKIGSVGKNPTCSLAAKGHVLPPEGNRSGSALILPLLPFGNK